MCRVAIGPDKDDRVSKAAWRALLAWRYSDDRV